MKKSYVFLLLIGFVAQSAILFPFEREQDIPRIVQNERQLMLHFMQGKGFFKNSNYEQAREEFLRVIQINSDYRPAYEYLERIQDIAIQKSQEEQERRAYMNRALDMMDTVKEKLRLPSDEDLFYQLTESEQKKLDGYVGDNEFSKMIEEQRLTVLNKAKQIKKDIDKVLEERQKSDVMRNVAGRDEAFMVQGFEPYTRENATMKENVERVAEAQEEMDANFFFNRRQKIESFYQRGVQAYKLRDYPLAKDMFEKVLKLEPGYRYAQDYHESSTSQLMIKEIQERKNRKLLKRARRNRKPRVQEPIEIVSQNRALEESSAVAEQMSQAFEERKGALLTGHRDELLATGIKAMEMKDYNKAMEIFEQILRYDPKDRSAEKYRQKILVHISEKEEAVLEALSQVQNMAFEESMSPATPKVDLDPNADFQANEALVDVVAKQRRVVELYEKGKHFYRQKNYTAALQHFRELELLDPAHRYVRKYMHRCEHLLNIGRKEVPRLDPAKLYAQGVKHFKNKEYRLAARRFWDVLKLNPQHRKAQKMLKKALSPLDMGIKTLLSEISAAEEVRSKPQAIEAMPAPKLPTITGEEDPETLYEKAKQLYRAGKYKQVIPLFETLVSLLPKDPHVERFLELSRKKFVKAGGQVKEVVPELVAKFKSQATSDLSLDPSNNLSAANAISPKFTVHYEKGKALFRQGQYKEAILEFEKAVKLVPNHRYAPRYLQRSKEKMQAQGKVAVASAQEMSPQDKEFKTNYEEGKYLYRQGQYAQAEPFFEKAVELKPNHRYASRYLERNKEKQAEKQAISQPLASPSLPAAGVATPQAEKQSVNEETFNRFYEEGKRLYRQGQYAQAGPFFEKAVELKPNHRYASRYLERSKEKQAEKQAISQPVASPSPPTPAIAIPQAEKQSVNEETFNRFYEEGKRLYRQGNYLEAIGQFEEAVKLNFNHRYAPRYLKRSREKWAERQEAQKERLATSETQAPAPAQQVVTEEQKNSKKLYEQGTTMYREGRYAEASDIFEQVVALEPNHLYAGGYLLRSKEKVSAAESRAQGASNPIVVTALTKSSPASSDVAEDSARLYEQGKTDFRQENYKGAIEKFKRVVLLDPNHRYVRRYLKKSEERFAEQKKNDVQTALYQDKQTDGVALGQKERFTAGEGVLEFRVNRNVGIIELSQEAAEILEFRSTQNKFVRVVGKEDFEAEEDLMMFERETSMEDYVEEPGEHVDIVLAEGDKKVAMKEARKRVRAVDVPVVAKRAKQKVLKKSNRKSRKAYFSGLKLYKRCNYKRAAIEFDKAVAFDEDNSLAQRYLVLSSQELKKKGITFKSEYLPENLSKVVQFKQPSVEEVKSVFEDAKPIMERVPISTDGSQDNYEVVKTVQMTDPAVLIKRKQQRENVKKIYTKGVEAYEAKDYETALVLFEQSSVMAPKNKSVLKALRLTKQKLSAAAKAKQMATQREEEKKVSQKIDVIYVRAKELFREKKYQEAYVIFKDVIAQDPKHYFAQKYFVKSREELIALGVDPEKKSIAMHQKALLTEEADMASRLFEKGKRNFEKKLYERAVKEFYVVKLMQPDHRHTCKYLNRSVKHIELSRWMDMKDNLDENFKKSPYYATQREGYALSRSDQKNIDSFITKGLRHYRRQEFEKALLFFDKARDIDPYYGELSIWKTNARYLLDILEHKINGEMEQVKVKSEFVLKTDPDNALAKKYATLGELELQFYKDEHKVLNQFQEELRQLKNKRTRQEKLVRAFQEAKILHEKGRYMEALNGFEDVLAQDPTNTYAMTFAKYARQRIQEKKKLELEMRKVEELQRAVEIQQEVKVYDYYERVEQAQAGMAIVATGEIPIKQPLDTNPDAVEKMTASEKAQAFVDKGKSAYLRGEYDKSVALLEKAIEMDDGANRDEIQIYLEQSIKKRECQKVPFISPRELTEEEKQIMLRNELMRKGRSLFYRNKYELAITQFEKVLGVEPGFEMAQKYMELVNKKLEIKRKQELERLQQSVYADEMSTMLQQEKRIVMLLEKGKEFFVQDQYRLAREHFEKVLELQEDHVIARDYLYLTEEKLVKRAMMEEKHLAEMQLLKIREEREERIHLAKQAKEKVRLQELKKQVQEIDRLFGEGKVAYEKGEVQVAIVYFEKILQINSKHRLAFEYLNLARQSLRTLQRNELKQVNREKQEVFQKEAEKYTNVQLAYDKGLIYYNRGEYGRALALFKRVWMLDQTFPYLTKVQEYIENISQRKMLANTSSPNQNYLAELYENGKDKFIAGQWQEAFSTFQSVSNIDAHYKSVQMYLQVAQGEIQKARAA